MKKRITIFFTALLTLIPVTEIFAQNSFSVKYVALNGGVNPSPNSIKVEADYDRHNHIISPPNSSTQTTTILESKYIINGRTVAYLSAPTLNLNTGQTFELFHLKAMWNYPQNGLVIQREYTFNNLQILSANNGNEINVTLSGATILLKAIHSGTHILYQISLK